jgi:hypothetical protein
MRAGSLVGLVLLVSACSSVSPVPIRAGDVCYRCRQSISDVKLAGEAIAATGQVMKFKTVRCLAQHLMDDTAPMTGVFVTDYASGRLVHTNVATFVQADVASDNTTGRRDFVAFTDVSAAIVFGEQHATRPVDWARVMQAVRAEMAAN